MTVFNTVLWQIAGGGEEEHVAEESKEMDEDDDDDAELFWWIDCPQSSEHCQHYARTDICRTAADLNIKT